MARHWSGVSRPLQDGAALGVELGRDLRPVEGVDVGGEVDHPESGAAIRLATAMAIILSTSVIPGRDLLARAGIR